MDEELKEVLRKIMKDNSLCGWDERECSYICHLCGGAASMWQDVAAIPHSEECGIHVIRKYVEG